MPTFLNMAAGTKFEVIKGYKGGGAINLAMERGGLFQKNTDAEFLDVVALHVDAINQAVVKALTMASFSYLKYMLGPYGVAIGVAELAIKAVPGIRLQPVVFEPGSSDLNPDSVAYLQKIAAILRERPDLKVSVCGLATETDRSYLSEQGLKQGTASSSIDDPLLELAQTRAEVIEDHLVNQYEIENKRIFICKPELDKNAEAPPRAELLV